VLIDVNKVDTISHPDEPGVTFGIRHLRGTEMDDASNQQAKKMVTLWAEQLDSFSKTARPDRPDTIATRVQKYDVSTLLKYAIVNWSYPEPTTSDNIDLLDGATRDWLAEEVVTRNTRPLPRASASESSSKSVESPTS